MQALQVIETHREQLLETFALDFANAPHTLLALQLWGQGQGLAAAVSLHVQKTHKVAEQLD